MNHVSVDTFTVSCGGGTVKTLRYTQQLHEELDTARKGSLPIVIDGQRWTIMAIEHREGGELIGALVIPYKEPARG